MAIYPGRRPGTRRVVIWHGGRSHEWIVEGGAKEAKAFEAAKRLELRASQVAPSPRGGLRFSPFVADSYVPHARQHLKASTWRVRQYQLWDLTERLGDLKLGDIDLSAIERYKAARLEAGAGAPAVNNELAVLRVALNYARALGHDVPPWKAKRLPVPGDEGRVRTWSGPELQRLLHAAADYPDPLQDLVLFLVNTGCRKGEAIACEWSWVDLEGRMLRIPATEYWRPKSGKPREVPLSDALMQLLRGPRRDVRWVFPSRQPGRASGRFSGFPNSHFTAARHAAGLDGGPHTLRHTFASHFLAAPGTDLTLLAAVMGHSQLRVTELYSHMLPGHLARARNAVNVAISDQTMAPTMATVRKLP